MTAQAVPYTTGNDLLAYKGDAGLAAGTNPGGILPQQGDPYGGISNTIDQINGELMQQKLLDYKQKAQDQEDLAKMLASTGGSVFNMKDPSTGQNVSYSPLPDDQKILDQKASDLRDMIINNPDKYMYNRDYLNARQQYNNLVSHAGVRSAAYSKYNLETQQSQDPQERQDIAAQRDAEVGNYKLTDFHMPEPHLGNIPAIDPIDEKDYKDEKTHQNFGTTIQGIKDAGGNSIDYEIKKHGIPNAPIYAPMLSNDTKTLTNAHIATQAWLKSPISKDPDYINAMNATITKNAAERGTQPVYAATVQPDGTIKYNQNPGQVLTAFNLEKHGWIQTDQKPTDEAQKQIDERAKIKLDQQKEAETHRHNVATENKEKTTAESLKEEQDRIAGEGAYKEAHAVFNAPYTKPVSISSVPAMVAATSVRNDGYNLYEVPNNVNTDKFVGIENPVETTTENTLDPKANNKVTESTKSTTQKGQSTKADNVYMAINPAGDKKLVYVKGGAVINEVPERDAVANSLKHDAKYDEKVYSNRAVWGQHYYDNGGSPSNTPAEAAKTKVVAPVTKVLGNVTYQNIDGRWFKVQ
jgi:hypothetical protein